MTNRIYMFLGLARRANALVLGEDGVKKDIKRRRIDLVIVASDVSANTRDSIVRTCDNYGVKIRFFGIKEEIGKCIGKGTVAIVGVKNKEFSKRLVEMIDGIKN